MKRFTAVFLAVLMALSVFSVGASAAETIKAQSGDFYGKTGSCEWRVYENADNTEMTLYISGNGNMQSLDLSESYPWTQYSEKITKVVVEEGVRNIGAYAFMNCSSLKSVSLPSTLEKIEHFAFLDCTALPDITVPGNVKLIEYSSFCGCTALKNAALCEGIKTVESGAFTSCGFDGIFVPSSVETIGSYAFGYNDDFLRYEDFTIFSDSYNSSAYTYSLDNSFNFELKDGPDIAATEPEEEPLPESAHPYYANENSTWIISREGAKALEITFSADTETEEGYDLIKLGGSGYSGKELAGKTVVVKGDTAEINLVSDGTNQYFGFRVVNVRAVYSSEYEESTTEPTEAPTEALIEPPTEPPTELEPPTEAPWQYTTAPDSGDDLPESEHPYVSYTDKEWEIKREGAESLEITFSADTETEKDYDFIIVGGISYTGTQLAGKTVTVFGDTAKIRLTTDSILHYYGFKVTNVKANYPQTEYEDTTAAPTEEPTEAPTEETTEALTAPPVTEPTELETKASDSLPESEHPYPNGLDESWEIKRPKASYISITFSSNTNIQQDCDFITIYDNDGQVVGKYTGSELAGKTVNVGGAYARIRFTTDYRGGEFYGFKVIEIAEHSGVMPSTIPATAPVTLVPTQPQAPASVPKLVKNAASLKAGVTFTIAVVNKGSAKVFYKSSNTKIATVSSSGKITALKKGSVKISVNVGGTVLPFTLNVISNPTLSKSSATLNIGGSVKLSVSGKVGSAKFSTTNKKVATVDSNGKVVAKKNGKAEIKVNVNGMTLKCKITVRKPSLNSKSITLTAGKTSKLKVKNYSGKVKWSSSDKKVATVSSGKVKGKKAGKATITANAGGIKLSCKVTVKAVKKAVKKPAKKTTKKTTKKTVKKTGLERLRDYIVKNGGKLDGEYFITIKLKNAISSIFYNKKTEKFQFLYSNDSDGKLTGEMYLSVKGASFTILETIFYSEGSYGVNGKATIIPSKYNSDTDIYKPAMSYNYSGWITKSYAYDFALTMTSLSMTSWGVLLAANGFSFGELGFTAYD